MKPRRVPLHESEKEVKIDISDQDFLVLAKRAHELNITFNHLVERLMMNYLLADKKAPETDEELFRDFAREAVARKIPYNVVSERVVLNYIELYNTAQKAEKKKKRSGKQK
jgi:hypothetical protein